MEGWMPFAARATRQNKRLIVLDPFRIPLFFVALCLSATKPKHRVIPCPLIVPSAQHFTTWNSSKNQRH
ncbi:hypothetical protein V2G26_014059 [Clonostachys chloroleuca]